MWGDVFFRGCIRIYLSRLLAEIKLDQATMVPRKCSARVGCVRCVRGPCQKDALSKLRKFVSRSKNTSTLRPRGLGGKARGWVENTVGGCARWVIFCEMDGWQHLPDRILPREKYANYD